METGDGGGKNLKFTKFGHVQRIKTLPSIAILMRAALLASFSNFAICRQVEPFSLIKRNDFGSLPVGTPPQMLGFSCAHF